MFSIEQAVQCVRSGLTGRLIGPYQTDGVQWMLSRELTGDDVKGGMLADEMGLGKVRDPLACCSPEHHRVEFLNL